MKETSLLRILAVVAFLLRGGTAQSWKQYPLILEGNPGLTFPGVEGAQYQDMSDSWFFTAQVTGQQTGKQYQVVTIFDRNYITAVILNFYQVSIFDYASGKFNTFTDYDLPGINLLDMKFSATAGYLDVGFKSSAGDASWITAQTADEELDPFVYDLYCPGTDHLSGSPFAFTMNANMQKKPVAYGASTLAGVFTFYGQSNTTTYWQPGPLITGSITFGGITENVTGTNGHIDRQIFPLYSGIDTPTGRQHSHEWRQINLSNGIDLAIWRQFDRVNDNELIETSGSTTSYPPPTPESDAAPPSWVDALPADLTVEYFSYAKFPRDNFSTLIQPPSQNMYLPSQHIIRSEALDMELMGTYTSVAPVAQLPIEYFEGPARWNGTYQGQTVSGVGIFESTLALYRDWELATVLLNSVAHLPTSDFSAAMSSTDVIAKVQELSSMVSDDPTQDHRVAAGSYARMTVIPALQSLANQQALEAMVEIADDFVSSLSLVLQF